jgi:4-hydroxy-tetrahydrodipicolinate reductase
MVIDLRASLDPAHERFYTLGKLKTEPGYHGVIAPCLQAIPHLCAARPGILPSFGPGLHWLQDLRESVTGH